MQSFNVRDELGHDAALAEASCTLEQVLALVDALTDEFESDPKIQNRLYAVEFMADAAMKLVQHAMTKEPEPVA